MTSLSYEQARAVIQDGDVVFFEGDPSKPMQALVMAATDSRFSHVAIAFWVGSGETRRCLLIEAHAKTKRRILLLSEYDNTKMVVVPGPLLWSRVQDVALSRVAREKYSYLSAIYIGLRELALKYFDIKLPAYDFPHEVCSEFIAKVYQLPDVVISPQVLFETLRSITGERQV